MFCRFFRFIFGFFWGEFIFLDFLDHHIRKSRFDPFSAIKLRIFSFSNFSFFFFFHKKKRKKKERKKKKEKKKKEKERKKERKKKKKKR